MAVLRIALTEDERRAMSARSTVGRAGAARALENGDVRLGPAVRRDGRPDGDRRHGTGALFVAYVEQQLARELSRGDVVVMDNLACHKRAGVRAEIERAGAELRYLPSYSPDLNPIENAFSRLKARLRADTLRTIPAVEDRLGALSATFAPGECRNYFRHRGYHDATPEREPLS